MSRHTCDLVGDVVIDNKFKHLMQWKKYNREERMVKLPPPVKPYALVMEEEKKRETRLLMVRFSM